MSRTIESTLTKWIEKEIGIFGKEIEIFGLAIFAHTEYCAYSSETFRISIIAESQHNDCVNHSQYQEQKSLNLNKLLSDWKQLSFIVPITE